MGTKAIKSFVSVSPRSSSNRFSAPEQQAMMKSVTVAPRVLAARLASASGVCRRVNTFEWLGVPFKEVRAASRTLGRATPANSSPLPCTVPAILSRTSATRDNPAATTSKRAPGRLSKSIAVCPSMSNEVGRAPTGSVDAGAGSRTSGVMSKSPAKVSAPDTPSARAWWTFITMAMCPPSRPSMTLNSQRGRSGRSSWAMTRPTKALSWSVSPGAGKARRMTCSLTSKSGSSANTGQAKSKGARITLLVSEGISWMRLAIFARIISKRSFGVRSSLVSNSMMAPMCRGVLGTSRVMKALSRGSRARQFIVRYSRSRRRHGWRRVAPRSAPG